MNMHTSVQRIWYSVASVLFGLMVFLAQPQYTNAIDPFVSLTLSPAYPKEGEMVSIDAISYAIDMQAAIITWYVNGVKELSAPGATQFSLPAGNTGRATTIDVVISASDGTTVQKSITFSPSSTDMIWEAVDSYTPPFYRGKALPVSGGTVKIVALPHITDTAGKNIADSNLVYTWHIDGFKRDVTSQSGYGKNILTIVKNILSHKETVGVDITSRDGSRSSASTTSLSTTNQEIIYYQYHPLLGILYNRVLTEQTNPATAEFSVLAEPFFFSLPQKNPNTLTYMWRMNGSTLPTDPSYPHMMTFGLPKGTRGNSSISLSIEHPLSVFQSASKQLSIFFDTTDINAGTSFSF